MKKFLLLGAGVVFAGLSATMAFAADHKGIRHAAPAAHASGITTEMTAPAHKRLEHKRHHGRKHHRHGHRSHRSK